MSTGGIWLFRPAIGEAAFLWLLLDHHAEQTNTPWRLVAGGAAISDTELATHLGVSETTARKWRLRLEEKELARSTLVALRSRKIEVRNIHFAEGEEPRIPPTRPGLVN